MKSMLKANQATKAVRQAASAKAARAQQRREAEARKAQRREEAQAQARARAEEAQRRIEESQRQFEAAQAAAEAAAAQAASAADSPQDDAAPRGGIFQRLFGGDDSRETTEEEAAQAVVEKNLEARAKTARLQAKTSFGQWAREEKQKASIVKEATQRSLDWFSAAECADATAIKRLLSSGSDIAARDVSGATALHIVAANVAEAEASALEALKALLEAGADPTASDYHGQNSVHKASLSGNASAIRLLARHKRGGAAASALDYFQRSPRALSLMNGHKECADMLVDTSAGGSKYVWRGNKTYCKIVMLSRFLCCPSR